MEMLSIDRENLQCQQHSEQATMIIIDSPLPFKETLLCQLCFAERNNEMSPKIISLSEYQHSIGDSENLIDKLRSFFNSITEFKEKTIKQSNAILESLSNWIRNIITKNQDEQLQNFTKQKESIEQIRLTQMNFIQTSFAKLHCLEELNKCNQNLNTILSYIQSKNSEIKTRKRTNSNQSDTLVPKQYQHINTVSQAQECHAIAFNKEGNLMITGCDKNIIVWQFQKGIFTEPKTLIGHISCVSCLVFSQQMNLFFSGSEDKTIRAWKEQKNNWTSAQANCQHSKQIKCLILTKNENELISCSGDKTIKSWKVDCQNVRYDYQLDLIHKGVVNSISLNQSESALVSCSCDDTIVLWMRGKNKKWEYTHQLQATTGFRICFVTDTQIVFQPLQENEMHLIEIENDQLVDNPNSKINLLLATDDNGLFPTIFNTQKQLIIQKQNNFVYLIQRQADGNFKIVLEPIDCFSLCNYGSLTEDGNYLVIWNFTTKEFRTYEIFY